MIKWTGEEKLRLCARDMRRRAALRDQKFKPKRTLKIIQVDAREELARLVGAEAKQRIDDAPPDREG